MRDRELDDIRSDMNAIKSIVESQFDETYDLIDTVCEDTPDLNDIREPSAWYLGKSILMLSEADLVVFDADWSNARGCIIEHMICALYNIPYVDIAMDYNFSTNDVNDYTHDWNFIGETNSDIEELTEDFEDALGFEHDDVDDLIESDTDLTKLDNSSSEFDDRRKKISDILNKSRNRNVQHSIDPEDELEEGEYDADANDAQ